MRSPRTTLFARAIVFATATVCVLSAAAQTPFTAWNFNAPGLSTTSPAASLASTGIASAFMIGGTTPGGSGAFLSDAGATDAGTGFSWVVGSFPAQGAGSGTGGVEFRTATTGYSNITFELDLKPRQTFSDYVDVQYSLTAGAAWTSFLAAPYRLPGTTSATAFVWTNDLGGGGGGAGVFTLPPAANDNADVRVRLVTVFDPTLGNAYSPNSPTNAAGAPHSYLSSPNSFVQIDMVEFKGEVLQPLPPSIVAEASGVTPGTLCAGTGSPINVEVTIAPGTVPASSSFMAWADASSVGAAAAAPMVFLGVDALGRFRFGLAAAASAATPTGARPILVSAIDNANRAAAATLYLSITTCCAADMDNDGTLSNGGAPDGGVDINDLLYFLAGFEAGSGAVDLDNDGDPAVGTPDGGVDINDLLFFLARFEAGC